ncbi:conserved Plasmodium protein, unknown function [Plasmodium gaboni]|uniref:Subpellicular microtubule protein 2 n=1 Tax=Plasmodium gaboni TaxID=647221 RepID=A0ABY1ULC2_9APIC|nr:conserved Plasmodium protein, unknown function [Plasmodium gaboni]
MSCLNVQPVQLPITNKFRNLPAGKPSQSHESTFCRFFSDTTEKEYKSSRRNINHRNKSSIFDCVEENDIIDNKKINHYNNSKKRFVSNNSLEFKKTFQKNINYVSNEKYGKKNIPDVRNLFIFSKQELSTDTKERKSSKKISNYSLEKNPNKWGVDVLKYNLPSPKKIYRHVDNLTTCLVPKISEDSFIPKKNKKYYVTHLEKSLCPKENILLLNSKKKLIQLHQSKLEMNCVPKDHEQEINKYKPVFLQRNLNNNLIPIVECKRRTFHVNDTCKNKQCSINFSCERKPSPYRSGKRIGYVLTQNDNPTFFF